MKNILFIIFSLCIIGACKTPKDPKRINVDPQLVTPPHPIPIMTFDRVLHDFGKIRKGDKPETTFNFTNTGAADLEIELITSCQCTSLDYSTNPVPPSGKGQIHIVFDSNKKENRSAMIDITIILKNTDPKTGYQLVETINYTYEIQ